MLNLYSYKLILSEFRVSKFKSNQDSKMSLLLDLQQQRDFRLLKAAVAGNVDEARGALRDGANVNVDGDAAEFATFSKKTALHWSAKKGHWDVVRLLLDRGASVSIKDHYGETALESVCFELEQGRLRSIPRDVKRRLDPSIPYSPSRLKNTLGKRLQDKMTSKKHVLERARKHSSNSSSVATRREHEEDDIPPGILKEEKKKEKTLAITEMQGFTAIGPGRNHETKWIEGPMEEVDMGGWTAKLYSKEQQKRLGVDLYGARSDKDNVKSRPVPTMSGAAVHHFVERKNDEAEGFMGNQLDAMSVGPIAYKKEEEEVEIDPVETSLRRLIVNSDVMDGKPAFLIDKMFRTLKDAYSRQDLMRMIGSTTKMENAMKHAIKVITNRQSSMPSLNDLDSSATTTPPRPTTTTATTNQMTKTTYSDHLNTPPHLNDDKTRVHVSRHGSIDIRQKMTPKPAKLLSPSKIPLPMVEKKVTREHVSRHGSIDIVTTTSKKKKQSPTTTTKIRKKEEEPTLSAPKQHKDGTLSGYLRNYLTSTIHCLRFYRLKSSTLFCYKSQLDSNERAQIDLVDTNVTAKVDLEYSFMIKTAHSELTLQTCDKKSFMVWFHALQRASRMKMSTVDELEEDEENDVPPPPSPPASDDDDDDDDDYDDDVDPPPPAPPLSFDDYDDEKEEDDPPPPPLPPSSISTSEISSSIFTKDVDEFPLPPSHAPGEEREKVTTSSIPKRGSNVSIGSASHVLDIPKKRWIEIYGSASTLNVQRKCMLWANTTARVKELDFTKSAVLLESFRTLNPKSKHALEDPPDWWPLECLK